MTDNIRNLLNSVENMIRKHDTCVLATAGDTEPHCSLMSYVPDPECRRIYMATLSNTKKFDNLVDNGNVSVLFDNRPDRTDPVMALTAAGTFERLSAEESAAVKKLLLAKHPNLKELLGDAHAEIFSVRFRSFQFLSGITDQQIMLLE
jgi:nitroimidazol reductase NimA-like FMN-containing flavoprotein (pyridoxamine 5'-phosphate oxidase superfamily)